VRLPAEDAEGGGRSSAPTPAGNFTLIGSIANLIVAQRASTGVSIGFWPYFKVGSPLTVMSILVALTV
jgi:Na+/H+ antiporter NhaD/arsenite permease-like protein